MPTLLAIDNDRTVLRLIERAFEGADLTTLTCSDAETGMPHILNGEVDVCLLDIMLPEMNGLELARKIRALDKRLPFIFITSMDDSDTAIEAMKLGAYDFCTKPLDIQQVQDLVERALEARRLMRSPVTFEQTGLVEVGDGEHLVGKSARMLEVYKQIGRVAAQQVPVLIRGESGTGKELIARAIYQHSHRQDECYLAVNCAALSETLLESELFGHEKGAFTGADRRHIGKFEQCSDGTIFLDEIGDMSPLLQSKTLRILQEQKFERVGGSKTIETDSRLISATNRDLEQMIEDNEFRLDVYHRINAFEIHLPPLREREDDIDLLVDHFIKRLSKSLGRAVEGISPEALQIIREYQWPGNVRELQSVIRRAMLMATGPVIVPENLSIELNGDTAINATNSRHELSPSTAGQPLPEGKSAADHGNTASHTPSEIESFVLQQVKENSNEIYSDTLAMMESILIKTILKHTGGNQSRAAELLGITRGSLRTKIRSLGIVIGQVITTDS